MIEEKKKWTRNMPKRDTALVLLEWEEVQKNSWIFSIKRSLLTEKLYLETAYRKEWGRRIQLPTLLFPLFPWPKLHLLDLNFPHWLTSFVTFCRLWSFALQYHILLNAVSYGNVQEFKFMAQLYLLQCQFGRPSIPEQMVIHYCCTVILRTHFHFSSCNPKH